MRIPLNVFRLVPLCIGILASLTGAEAQEPVGVFRTEIKELHIEAQEGMYFHPPRAKAKAGSRLELNFYNADPNDMPHNVCLVAPGALAEIQQASLAIDSGAEARGFVPDHEAVLAHSELVGSGESSRFSFQFPEDARGVYYLVCTFPGHAGMMYTPLYVGSNYRLSLLEDPEVSPIAKQRESAKLAAIENVERPSVLRAIMDDTGPATILVALPNDMNFCWDAGSCRLRYAWTGKFANPMPHFAGNGSKRPEILGDEFWRSRPGERTIGVAPMDEAEERPKYLGYDLEDGIPTFRYRVKGSEVRERITEEEGSLKWTIEVVGSPEKTDWSVLAPESELANIVATKGRREGDELLFSRKDGQAFEVSISPNQQ